MPIGTRDLLLVIRAKDQASRTLAEVARGVGAIGQSGANVGAQMRQIGGGLTSIGAGIGAVGVAGLAFLKNATDVAVEFDKQARNVWTQVDAGRGSLTEIKDVIRDVGRTIPAELGQLPDALFDIFSSMDVGIKDARVLLEAFAKGAVAGNTDVQTAGRNTIAIMNAFKIPFSDVNTVMDLQFQLVRKGVGTYEEFASSMGKAIPAAVNAGQNFKTLGGIMTFLTRNGIKVADASTSAARALDAIANPKVQENLKGLGIAVADAQGNFRPFLDIISDLNDRFKTLSPEARAQAIFTLLKGTGSFAIQARRFFNLALNDFDTFATRVGEMEGAAGAMGEAFEKNSNSAAAQGILLKNNWKLLREEIGAQLIPALLKMQQWIFKAMEAWNSLSDGTRQTIVKFVAVAAVIATVSGAVIMMIGFVLMFVGTLVMMGAKVGTAIAILAAIPAVIALIGIAIFLVIKHWNTLREIIGSGVNAIKEAFGGLASLIAPILDGIKGNFYLLGMAWRRIVDGDLLGGLRLVGEFFDRIFGGSGTISSAVRGFVDFLGTIPAQVELFWLNIKDRTLGIWETIVTGIRPILDTISELVGSVISYIRTFWDENGAAMLASVVSVFNTIVEAANTILPPLVETVAKIFNAILVVVKPILIAVLTIIRFALGIITAIWKATGDDLLKNVAVVWNTIFSVIKAVITAVSAFIRVILNMINGDFEAANDALIDMVHALWDGILAIFKGVGMLVVNTVKGFIDAIIGVFKYLYDIVIGNSIIPDLINAIVDWFKSLPGKVVAFVRDLVDRVIDGFLVLARMVGAHVQDVIHTVLSIKDKILGALSGAKDWLFDAGKNIVDGLINGVKNMAGKAVDAIKKTAGDMVQGALDIIKPGSPSRVFTDIGKTIPQGLALGIDKELFRLGASMSDISDMLRLGSSNNIGVSDITNGQATVNVPTGNGSLTLNIEQGAIQINNPPDADAAAQAVKDALQEIIRERRVRG